MNLTELANSIILKVLGIVGTVFLCVHALYVIYTAQDVLKSLESHQQVFQRFHKDRSVDGVPVPPDQLQDMAERLERHKPQPDLYIFSLNIHVGLIIFCKFCLFLG